MGANIHWTSKRYVSKASKLVMKSFAIGDECPTSLQQTRAQKKLYNSQNKMHFAKARVKNDLARQNSPERSPGGCDTSCR